MVADSLASVVPCERTPSSSVIPLFSTSAIFTGQAEWQPSTPVEQPLPDTERASSEHAREPRRRRGHCFADTMSYLIWALSRNGLAWSKAGLATSVRLFADRGEPERVRPPILFFSLHLGLVPGCEGEIYLAVCLVCFGPEPCHYSVKWSLQNQREVGPHIPRSPLLEKAP